MGCERCGKPIRTRPDRHVRFCSRTCANKTTAQEHKEDDAERFWRRVNKAGPCWLWLGARSGEGGYGYSWFQGKLQRAHRIAWQLTYFTIPSGFMVLHTCDQPECVRPDHLWLGTHTDNMADRERKGRTRNGDGRYRKEPAR